MSSEVFLKLIPAFISFCLAASAGYIVNDIKDKHVDKNHEKKQKRPIASGAISVPVAVAITLFLLAASIATSSFISKTFCLYLVSYITITLSYSFFLKNLVVIDLFAISFGFVVRVLAGGIASGVAVSGWLFMSVFLVALFLSVGKRLGELISLGENAINHRKSLAAYNLSFLEGALWFAASTSLVTYALYTIEHNYILLYTVPMAAFGLLRYIYIAKKGHGDPTEALLKDRQILITGVMWAATIGYVIYGR